jgi:hypothetical protein
MVLEYSGLGLFDVIGAMNYQTNPPTTANAVTSGTVAITAGDTAIGITLDWAGNGTITAGTANGWTQNYSVAGIYMAESQTGTLGTRGATFTASVNTDRFNTALLAFKAPATSVAWGFEDESFGRRAARRIGWRAPQQRSIDDISGFPFTAVKTGTAYYEEEIHRRQLPVRWHASPQSDVTDGFPFTAAASVVPPWAFDDERRPRRIAASRVPFQEDLIQGQASVPWGFAEEPRRLTRQTASRSHLEPLLGFGYPVARTPSVYYEEEQHTFQRNRPQRPARAERSRDLEGLLFLLSIIADQRAVLEWYAFMAIDCPPLAEALAGSKTDSIAIQEIVAFGRNDGGLVDENLAARSADGAPAAEALAGARSDPIVSAEALAASATDQRPAIEELGGSRADPGVATENTADSRVDIGKVNTESGSLEAPRSVLSDESLSGQTSDRGAPDESLLTVRMDPSVEAEALASSRSDPPVNQEATAASRFDVSNVRSEFQARVAGDASILFEALAQLRGDSSVQIEWTSSTLVVLADAFIALEFLAATVGDRGFWSEWLSFDSTDIVARSEFVAAVLRGRGNLILEALASASGEGFARAELFGGIRADPPAQAEYGSSSAGSARLWDEFLTRVIGDATAISEALSRQLSDPSAQAEFTANSCPVVLIFYCPGPGGFRIYACCKERGWPYGRRGAGSGAGSSWHVRAQRKPDGKHPAHRWRRRGGARNNESYEHLAFRQYGHVEPSRVDRRWRYCGGIFSPKSFYSGFYHGRCR